MEIEEGGGGRKGGASLWSGLKSMFHGRPRAGETATATMDRQRRLEHSAFSYSCLGQGKANTIEADESYGVGQSAARNISYSHESVFQMEPHYTQPPPGAPGVPGAPASPRLRNTSSSVALPSLVHSELVNVLAERQYCGQAGPRRRMTLAAKAGSESCLTDEEDLGLPASLQHSPADYTRSLHSSRHHSSSCSDNSLLSLDSDHGVTDSGAESLGSGQVGQLSHLAARHKIAVRPRRNHAVKAHRRLQQLTEEQEPSQPCQSSVETSLAKKSQSLEGPPPPSSSQLREMSREESSSKRDSKHRQKGDQDGNFLSRLFGSKRLRLKSSSSKRGGGSGETETAGPAPALAPAPGTEEQPQPDMERRVTPPRHKQKPPPPPPPDTSPPPGYPAQQGLQGVQVLPPLPTKKTDIILKKKAGLGGAESHERFQSSVQSWSLASEGRVRSLVSLNERVRPAQSTESLATINSLLEEPDLLEHTSIVTEGRAGPEINLNVDSDRTEREQDNDDWAGSYLGENKDVETLSDVSDVSDVSDPSDVNHLITPAGLQTDGEQSQSSPHLQLQPQPERSIKPPGQSDTESGLEPAGPEVCGDGEVNQIPTTGGVTGGGVGAFPVVGTDRQSSAEEEQLAEESVTLTAVNKLTTTIPSLAEIISNNSHNDASATGTTGPQSQAIVDNKEEEEEESQLGSNKISNLQPRPQPAKDCNAKRLAESELRSGDIALQNTRRGESEEHTLVEAVEENETTKKCNQVNIKRKPEISPKPVPAPRTFFLRPASKSSSGVLESGAKTYNELLTVFARRSTSVTDVEDLKSNSSSVSPPAPLVKPDDKPESKDPELNVKERAKSFSGLQNYPLGPKPFRPTVSGGPERELDKQKPRVAQKPTPAPRQLRSFPKLETAGTAGTGAHNASHQPPPTMGFKTVKSASALELGSGDQMIIQQELPEIKMKMDPAQSQSPSQAASSDKNLNNKDEYNLDDIQVRKIADKFQKNTPPKPMRKSTSSSPSNKKQEDENTEAKNVMNIVTKINSMVVL